MRHKILFIFIIIPLLFSCKEVYYPDLNSTDKILVVSGAITNQHGVQTISLSWAKSFNNNDNLEPVKNAQVYITDKSLENYSFVEGDSGIYYSDTLVFVPQIGNAYKLRVVLESGEEYESDYQEMLPFETLGEIYGKIEQKDFIVDNGDNLLLRTYEGMQLYMPIPVSNGAIPKYRFGFKLQAQYVWSFDSGPDLFLYYCWKTLKNPSNINITGSQHDVSIEDSIIHSLCFLPMNQDYWNLPYACRCFVMSVEVYRLNDESYSFYKKAYDQLEADNSIFDPIAVQLPSNLKCVSNSNKKVLGFFEVSSISSSTYYILEGKSSTVTCVKNSDYPWSIGAGSILNSTPYFWYSYYIK